MNRIAAIVKIAFVGVSPFLHGCASRLAAFLKGLEVILVNPVSLTGIFWSRRVDRREFSGAYPVPDGPGLHAVPGGNLFAGVEFSQNFHLLLCRITGPVWAVSLR